MTETPRTTVCPDCSALVPHTPADMQGHRAKHNDEQRKHDGVRSRLREQDEKIARLTRELETLRGEVDHIEIPEAVAPLEISDAPDDWGALPEYEPAVSDDQPVSQYVDDYETDVSSSTWHATTATTPGVTTAQFGSIAP